MLRVRVDNFGITDSAPGQQCCWTNGYVKVKVTVAVSPILSAVSDMVMLLANAGRTVSTA